MFIFYDPMSNCNKWDEMTKGEPPKFAWVTSSHSVNRLWLVWRRLKFAIMSQKLCSALLNRAGFLKCRGKIL